MVKIISSQHFLDDEIVQSKVDAADFVVTLSPVFEVEGVVVQVVLDGHHSFAAAQRVGVEPEYEVATVQTNDAINLIAADPVSFLEAVWVDGDYYDVINGGDVW